MPETKYAKSGDVHIAYQVVGEAAVDLVFIPWWWNHLEMQWDDPLMARFLTRLSSFSRLILFDQRGSGLSDPIPVNEPPTLEQWMDDVRAVMDAAGSERAAIFGHGDGAMISMLFAASHPDRTASLVLAESCARIPEADDYAGGSPEFIQTVFDELKKWGSGYMLDYVAPDLAGDDAFRAQLARVERLSVSPSTATTIQRVVIDADLRPVLPTLSVPTLMLHRKDNRYVRVEWGRYVAEHIRGARFVEFPGNEHLWWLGATDAMLDEVEEFITGARPTVEADRVLATILFADIAGSTERAAELGDRSWRDVLDRFRARIRDELRRFRGREINTRGDDFLATFDGPARAIRCALAITESARAMGVEVRSGLHTGEIQLMGDDIGGIAVHIGARVGALAAPGQVLVSRTVVDLVAGSGISFDDRGEHELKGVPGRWSIFSVQV